MFARLVVSKAGTRQVRNLSTAVGVPNFILAVDKGYRSRDIADVGSIPIDALEGVGKDAAESWKKMGVKTVRDLSELKYGRWAEAISHLSHFHTNKENQGEFGVDILGTVIDHSHLKGSLQDIVDSDVQALKGVGPVTTSCLNRIGILTIRDLAQYRHRHTAIALMTMGDVQNTIKHNNEGIHQS